MNLPPPPTGMGPAAAWMQRLWLYVKTNRIRPAPGYRTIVTSDGTFLEVAPRGGGSKGGTGGMNYRGDYDITLSYSVNDVVRVRTTPYPNGIWICVRAQPANGNPPQFPEPKDLDVNNSNDWELLALGVQKFNACQGSQIKTVYINMNQV